VGICGQAPIDHPDFFRVPGASLHRFHLGHSGHGGGCNPARRRDRAAALRTWGGRGRLRDEPVCPMPTGTAG
jgi:hypothetical protein